MKILHICTGYPISYQGGITNYVRMLAEYQTSMGFEVDVLGGPDKSKDICKFNYIEFQSSIRPFTLGYPKDPKSLNIIKNIIEKNAYDLIHIHMMLDIDIEFLKLIKKYKYIVSLHDYFYLCPRIIMLDKNGKLCTQFNKDSCSKCVGVLEQIRGFKKVFLKLNMKLPSIKSSMTYKRFNEFKKFLENAEVLLPVSNRVKEIYQASGINGNYEVLHIGNITAEKFDHIKKEINEFEARNIKCGFIGTLSYHKGAEILLKILNNVKRKDIEFHMYGSVQKEYETALVNSGLILHGRYSQGQMDNIMTDIDIGLVLPIWEDNAPQVVMEFLNYKIPVIACAMGGITDFINSRNGYLFNPYSTEDMNRLFEYIENINRKDIKYLSSMIVRTKLPSEHLNEINNLYNKILNL